MKGSIKDTILLVMLMACAMAVVIRQAPYAGRSVSGEFDNATIIKTNGNLLVQTKSKNISLLNVPDVYQATDYTCGPSSLTAVLSYYGKEDLRQMDLAKLAKTDKEVGTMPQQLLRAATQLGFSGEFQENMTIRMLQDYIADSRPVIVLIQAWKDDDDTTPYPINFQNGHYVVAIGYDNDNIFFQDPWIHGSITYMSKADLTDRWHGNTDQPYDRHIYGAGVIVLQPLATIPTVIYLQ